MSSKKLFAFLSLVLVFSMVLAACAAPTAEPVEEPVEEEPMDEEMDDEEPMDEDDMGTMLEGDPSGQTVVFWHAFSSGANLESITEVVDEFNATNEYGITVEAVSQGSQGDLGTAMRGAITTGELPTVTMGFPNDMANYHNLGVIAELNDFVNDPMYGIDAEVWNAIQPGGLEGVTLGDGTIIGIPVRQSVGALFYNFTWAEELGFDGPPTTPEEFKAQACAAAAANAADDNPDNDDAGYVMYNDASYILPWYVAFGGDFLTADGTNYDLNNETALEVALFLKDLVDSDCTLTTPSFPNPEVAGRLALYAGSSSAGIPFQRSAFEDVGNEDTWGVIGFPGSAGVVGNAYIQPAGVVDTNPDANLASFLFLKYLTSPEVQVTTTLSTGYMPVNNLADIGTKAEDDVQWGQAFELLQSNSFSEPPIAAHFAVRGLIQDAFDAIVAAADEAEVQAILDQLQADAEEAVSETQ